MLCFSSYWIIKQLRTFLYLLQRDAEKRFILIHLLTPIVFFMFFCCSTVLLFYCSAVIHSSKNPKYKQALTTDLGLIL